MKNCYDAQEKKNAVEILTKWNGTFDALKQSWISTKMLQGDTFPSYYWKSHFKHGWLDGRDK